MDNTQGHTPGEWIVSGISIVLSDQPKTEICSMKCIDLCSIPSTIPYSEALANARLMASAPELLAALKVLTLDPRLAAAVSLTDPMARRQCLKAIAKAEGGD